eukprot:c48989_g1_i1 orf=38-196(-)
MSLSCSVIVLEMHLAQYSIWIFSYISVTLSMKSRYIFLTCLHVDCWESLGNS